jgi:hypothetical protein
VNVSELTPTPEASPLLLLLRRHDSLGESECVVCIAVLVSKLSDLFLAKKFNGNGQVVHAVIFLS